MKISDTYSLINSGWGGREWFVRIAVPNDDRGRCMSRVSIL